MSRTSVGLGFPRWIGAAFLAALVLFTFAAVLPGQAPAPAVEVFGPPTYPVGQWFEVVAEARGCAPQRWAWRVGPGGVLLLEKGGTARVVFSRPSEIAFVEARALGGGCRRTAGRTSVLITNPPPPEDLREIPYCDEPDAGFDQEGGEIYKPRQVSRYIFEPGLPSTGRLEIKVVASVCRKRESGTEPEKK